MDINQEIEAGKRFEFGVNWARFLTVTDDKHVNEAESSLKEMLCVANLEGQSFLDIGCGSGLFSLAARRLGARVHSFDFDTSSVLCAQRLRGLHRPDDREWTIEQGSILDPDYVSKLGTYDVAYSWGVLHHTGAMHASLDAAAGTVS